MKNLVLAEYDAFVIKADDGIDRPVEIGYFGMATNPENPHNLFTKSEMVQNEFSNYASLRLNYVAVGGNNSNTRFGRYIGNDEESPLLDHDLTELDHLITIKVLNQICLIRWNDILQDYWRDTLVFDCRHKQHNIQWIFGQRSVDTSVAPNNSEAMFHGRIKSILWISLIFIEKLKRI